MRVLVTGAAGFLGTAVTAALARHGHEPVAFIRRDRPEPDGAVATRRGDIGDLDGVCAAVADVEAVCHLAGLARVRDSIADPLLYWRTNLGGTLNVLDALVAVADRNRPKRLVLASTAAVYGTPERQPINEDAPTTPGNPYGASKLAADYAAAHVAATGTLGAISLRAFNIAGAAGGVPDRDISRLIPKLLAVQAGLEPELAINGDGSAVRDFVHVIDMAEAFVLALGGCTPGQWRAYNVGGGRRTRVLDVVRSVEQVTAGRVAVRHNPPAHEPPVLLADSTRITQELGWQPLNSDLSQILSDGWKALNNTYSAQE